MRVWERWEIISNAICLIAQMGYLDPHPFNGVIRLGSGNNVSSLNKTIPMPFGLQFSISCQAGRKVMPLLDTLFFNATN
jgi:hypothetical protein